MARRSRSNLEALTHLPWPVGIVVGLILFAAIRYGLPELIGSIHIGGHAMALTDERLKPIATLAWIVLAVCWLAAGLSWLGGRQRSRLFDQQRNLDSVATLDWRDFERLVGEYYRRAGWAVQETGLGGKDGGIDLVLRRNGETLLVQCKQWRRRQIPVTVVRELWGLAQHHGADRVVLACIGTYTPDASAFAAGKPIDLINGENLLAMIQSVQARGGPPTTPGSQAVAAANTTGAITAGTPAPSGSATPASPPPCPLCAAPMVRRTNRTTGQAFHGCSGYPKCRGTRPT